MKTNKPDHREVVVAMTTFPAAAPYAARAVRSILRGDVLPDRVVLYVTMAQFGPEGLPDELKRIEAESPIFEIRDYPVDIRSYRKLIPALADFPEAVIVTVDDDVDYHPRMLAELLVLHSRLPLDVLAHRAKRIRPGRPYRKWPKYRWYHFLGRPLRPGCDVLQTGVGGVLYPPHCLRADMLDPQLFMEAAPTTDDIWFWAAAVANGRRVAPVPFGRNKPRGLGKPKELSLKIDNFKRSTDRNAAALAAICERYPEIKQRLHDGY